jgi:hypothetical protein
LPAHAMVKTLVAGQPELVRSLEAWGTGVAVGVIVPVEWSGRLLWSVDLVDSGSTTRRVFLPGAVFPYHVWLDEPYAYACDPAGSFTVHRWTLP